MKTIIDVSHWQGDIDFNKVKASGVEGVIIKAGGSDSGFYTDSKFEQNYTNAKSAGLPVGAYYFVGSGCTSAEDGKADAQRFVEIVKDKEFEMPLYMDVETTPTTKKEGTTDAVIAFCDELIANGRKAGIYASDISGFKNRMNYSSLKDKGYSMWVAKYSDNAPTYVTEYDIWQYSSKGSVDGIEGNVDMNHLYKEFTNGETSQVQENTSVANIEPAGTTLELIVRTLKDEFGSGDERKAKLGSRYTEVQDLINLARNGSVDDIVKAVWQNKFGDGETRKFILGDRYEEVRNKINGTSNQSQAVYYKVKGGDSLWKIAKAYYGDGSQYPTIKKLNNLSSDVIYAGMTLRVK